MGDKWKHSHENSSVHHNKHSTNRMHYPSSWSKITSVFSNWCSGDWRQWHHYPSFGHLRAFLLSPSLAATFRAFTWEAWRSDSRNVHGRASFRFHMIGDLLPPVYWTPIISCMHWWHRASKPNKDITFRFKVNSKSWLRMHSDDQASFFDSHLNVPLTVNSNFKFNAIRQGFWTDLSILYHYFYYY